MSKHGATWWSGRFLRSLERLGMTTRLKRGHSYYLEGRVLRLDVQPGVVSSVVRGAEDYDCQIYFEPLSDMEWTESLDRLALGDLSAAALLVLPRAFVWALAWVLAERVCVLHGVKWFDTLEI